MQSAVNKLMQDSFTEIKTLKLTGKRQAGFMSRSILEEIQTSGG